MGKHDQPIIDQYNKTAVKLALSASTVAGVFAFSNAASADTYTVESGDNLWNIAQKFNTSVEALTALNGISDPAQISTGQTIETSQPAQIIPTPTVAKASTAPAKAQPAVTYTVQAGDTLSQIAQTHGVSVEDIIKYSKLNNTDFIYIGQELVIKPAVAAKRPEPIVIPAVTYTVKSGDTLWDIAQAQNVSVEDIVKHSKLSSTDYIFAGQELIIKPAKTINGGILSISAETLASETNLSVDNAQNAIDIANHLMVQEGFTLEGASGALAVAERESGFNPETVNDSGGVAGVFQWSGWSNMVNGNRWANAESRTLSLDVQMNLVSTELNGAFTNVKDIVGNATDPVQASLDWSLYYEGVALADPQTKVDTIEANAQKWYDLLKDYVDFDGNVAVPIDVNQGPYSTGNTYAAENCTWYVKDVFKARMGDWWGNAKDWAANASREGLQVDDQPVANSTIAV
ncbi:MAG: phage tail tip lysozyme, partial [Pseudolactococcus laudensis]